MYAKKKASVILSKCCILNCRLYLTCIFANCAQFPLELVRDKNNLIPVDNSTNKEK